MIKRRIQSHYKTKDLLELYSAIQGVNSKIQTDKKREIKQKTKQNSTEKNQIIIKKNNDNDNNK